MMRALILAVAVFVVVGCTSPVAPAPVDAATPGGTAVLMVTTTIGDVTGPPLGDVTIALDGRAVAVTDATGRAWFYVPTRREVEIRVSHPTRRPFVPAGVATFQPWSHEKWAFAFVPD